MQNRGCLVYRESLYQPGPAIQLLKQVKDYQFQKIAVGEEEPIDPAFIEKVFSIYSGLPRFVVSKNEVIPAKDIRNWFQDRVIGQSAAVEAVIETIALLKSGLNDPQKPLGTFLFVGPTGVGKTEMARALATFLFGSPNRLLRFDLSEYKDFHSFEMLVGNINKPEAPARLTDPVKTQPFQVVLFDEIEKGHPNVWDLFLQLLDEGRLTPAGGETVNFRNTIIIVTSNVGASQSSSSLGFGAGPNSSDRDKTIQRELEKEFRPEFINRFQHIVTFKPLSRDTVRKIARLELARVLSRKGIQDRNILIDIDDKTLECVIETGFDPKYGARALKREIQKRLVMPLAIAIMEKDFQPGTVLRVTEYKNQIRIKPVDTPESRAGKKEMGPVKSAKGEKKNAADLKSELETIQERIDHISLGMDYDALSEKRDSLMERRSEPDFWNDSENALLVLRDMDMLSSWIDRFDRLKAFYEEAENEARTLQLRSELETLSQKTERLKEATDVAHRELALIGQHGIWDALVEIKPLGQTGSIARDRLFQCYKDWALSRKMTIELLYDPLQDDERIFFSIQGEYAVGYLELENGLHYVDEEKENQKNTSAVVVTVAPWRETTEPPDLGAHRALKLIGQSGEKIRSRLECNNGMVLQNAKSLAENRDLAFQLYHSWANRPETSDQTVRRTLLQPDFRVRDYISGIHTGKKEVLAAKGFHHLLCMKIDTVYDK